MEAVTSGLNTEIFSAEREWTVEGLPVLTAQVSLPEPVGSENRTARRIRRYYRAQCRAFLRYCDRWLFPMAARACREALADSRPLPQFQAELSFRVTYNEGGFWSLYTQIREPAADGHILLRRWGDTWDLRRGYPVSLPSFFPHRRGWKRQPADFGRSGDPASGDCRVRPVSGRLAKAAAAAVQPHAVLPHPGEVKPHGVELLPQPP